MDCDVTVTTDKKCVVVVLGYKRLPEIKFLSENEIKINKSAMTVIQGRIET